MRIVKAQFAGRSVLREGTKSHAEMFCSELVTVSSIRGRGLSYVARFVWHTRRTRSKLVRIYVLAPGDHQRIRILLTRGMPLLNDPTQPVNS